MDTNGHGIQMAGIIGAVGNNSLGITGINWKARIMALKCTTGSGTVGSVEDAITAINYAMETKVTYGYRMVIVLGWTTNGYSRALRDVIRLAQLKGILVVAPAGDDDEDDDLFPAYPAAYALSSDGTNNIISVGASDGFDKKAGAVDYCNSGSNYGCAAVDLFAPGKENLTTTIKGSSPDYTNAYTAASGSPIAAAHVAGAVALVWSKNPAKNWKEIKGLVLNGAEDGQTTDFRPICMAWERLNLYNTVAVAPLCVSKLLSQTALGRMRLGRAVTLPNTSAREGKQCSWWLNRKNQLSDREYCENSCRPERMGDDKDWQVPRPEVEGAPESACHKGGEDEHGVAGKDVDARVNEGRGDIAGKRSPALHHPGLEKGTPEYLFTRPGDEKE
jgi:hypothetical protein